MRTYQTVVANSNPKNKVKTSLSLSLSLSLSFYFILCYCLFLFAISCIFDNSGNSCDTQIKIHIYRYRVDTYSHMLDSFYFPLEKSSQIHYC